jgi:hypothetical protein
MTGWRSSAPRAPTPKMLRALATRGERYMEADELAAVLAKKPSARGRDLIRICGEGVSEGLIPNKKAGRCGRPHRDSCELVASALCCRLRRKPRAEKHKGKPITASEIPHSHRLIEVARPV